MKRFKRLSALLLALGTVCSLMAPAGAAAAAPLDQRSEFAGTTHTVQVVTSDFAGNGGDVYMVNVPVPANATKAEELALFQTAALQAAGMPATRGTPTIGDTLFTANNRTLAAAGSAQVIGEGTLGRKYSTLLVTFDGVTTSNGASRLNVRVSNNHGGSNSYASNSIRLGTYTTVLLLTSGGGDSQGGSTLALNKGDYITVWSSVNQGSAFVRNFYVSAQ